MVTILIHMFLALLTCDADPDDNRHDLRPFLYVVNFPYQFDKIKAHAENLEAKMQK